MTVLSNQEMEILEQKHCNKTLSVLCCIHNKNKIVS
jgi:hypothetical protein